MGEQTRMTCTDPDRMPEYLRTYHDGRDPVRLWRRFALECHRRLAHLIGPEARRSRGRSRAA